MANRDSRSACVVPGEAEAGAVAPCRRSSAQRLGSRRFSNAWANCAATRGEALRAPVLPEALQRRWAGFDRPIAPPRGALGAVLPHDGDLARTFVAGRLAAAGRAPQRAPPRRRPATVGRGPCRNGAPAAGPVAKFRSIRLHRAFLAQPPRRRLGCRSSPRQARARPRRRLGPRSSPRQARARPRRRRRCRQRTSFQRTPVRSRSSLIRRLDRETEARLPRRRSSAPSSSPLRAFRFRRFGPGAALRRRSPRRRLCAPRETPTFSLCGWQNRESAEFEAKCSLEQPVKDVI